MRDVEKTLKNLDRAHKIRVRRCFADPRSTRHGLQTTSKIHRKIEDKFEGKNDRKTDRKWRPRTLQIRRLGRPGGPSDEQVRAPRRPSRATKRVRSACGASENVLVASNEATSSEKARPVPPRSARASEVPEEKFRNLRMDTYTSHGHHPRHLLETTQSPTHCPKIGDEALQIRICSAFESGSLSLSLRSCAAG